MPIETLDDAKQSARALFAETEIENNEPVVEESATEPVTETGAEPILGATGGINREPMNGDQTAEPVAEPAAEPTGNLMLENAVAAAENAAQIASRQAGQMNVLNAELERLRQMNAQQAGIIDQMSRQQKESIVEDALKPPTLDFSSMAFDDEETALKKQAQFTQEMADYQRQAVMREIAPFLEEAKAGRAEKEKAQLFAELASDSRFSDMGAKSAMLDNIIANNPELFSADMDTDKKYIAAYAMAKGIESMNAPAPKEPSAQELYELYKKNPELQSMIEQERIEQLKASQQVPNMAASSGAANAALTIKDKPKTMKDAGAAARKLFGGLF